MGRSGRSAAALLHALGVQLHLYDAKVPEAASDFGESFVDPDTIPDAAFEGVDLIVLSPGVPPAMPRARAADRAPDARIVGELGLALELLRAADRLPELCLVTGTNGKSTITALIGHLLEQHYPRVFTGGNLGIPLCDIVLEIHRGAEAPSHAVIECSSYQLETLPSGDDAIPTAVGILSNISPDHLARYDSLEHYARTKTAVFWGLGRLGLALLDDEDAWTDRLTPDEVPVERVMSAQGPRLVQSERTVGANQTLFLSPGVQFDRATLQAAGRHNAKNALFALRAAEHMGVPFTALAAGLASFEGLPHRMAFVRTHAGVSYFDDSKATNVASALAGLAGFARPFVLIAGGQLKGDPLDPLIDVVVAEGRGLVAIGEGADTLLAVAGDRVPTRKARDMAHAIELARELATVGDAIVLSPAGASWDMYANFAKRGEHFAAIVRAL